MVVEGLASFVVGQKLKMLKEKNSYMEREKFSGLEGKKQSCLKKVEFQQIEMMEGLSQEEEMVKAKAGNEYIRILRMEEISWK